MGSAVQGCIDEVLADCARAWGEPDLAATVTVAVSARLRTSLGRCHPLTGHIALHPSLTRESLDRLPLVLSHELAHLVAYRRHGAVANPHGPQWRALVQAAGFDPSVTLSGFDGESAESVNPILMYVHTCPVCHSRRLARRPVRRWRCAECVGAGLRGELMISRLRPAT